MGFCIFHPEAHLLQTGILEVASRIFDSIPADSSQSDGPGLIGEGETRCEIGTAPHQPVPVAASPFDTPPFWLALSCLALRPIVSWVRPLIALVLRTSLCQQGEPVSSSL